ncbi:MAG: choice-of-anchor L domain-containing protein [Desulforegulaceae bacterium]|nr:choice-of-anchor L domain-containing protein [Desulforegulaceae bacterium]
MKQAKALFLIFFLFLMSSVNAGAVTITPFDNSDNMAQTLLGTGITIVGTSYTGANEASGYFSDGLLSGLEIDKGILLTSGFALNANGTVNTSDSITGNNNLPGSSILDDLIPGYETFDATILSIDFQSSGENAYFNYIFASDEYNEYVDSSFNDVFGFFMNDINYALIPGTQTPVSINNVNNNRNSSFYFDNENGDYMFEYDGFTSMFTVNINDLTPGETYNLKLAIADAGDYAYDSGVFIQAGSFSNTLDPVPEPSTLILFGLGILGLCSFMRKKQN